MERVTAAGTGGFSVQKQLFRAPVIAMLHTMNLHEYQAKSLFRQAGLPVPSGELIRSLNELPAAWARLGADRVLVKAQIHSGARGKAGGVVLAGQRNEAEAAVRRLLGTRLVTGQTGSDGLPVNEILLEPAARIAREFYFGMLVDRSRAQVVTVVSADGGTEIEALARTRPQALLNLSIHSVTGILPFHVRRVVQFLGLQGKAAGQMMQILLQSFALFQSSDAQLLEINPLVLTEEGELLALDAKLVLDDSAAFRQTELFALRDARQSHPAEERALPFGLNYIRLEGSIGCMVNGAGLAMATMDLIQHHGGSPANFLDVGGGTTTERVAEAFKLILSDDSVRAVLVNIFGGIVRCDLIAQGLIAAIQEVQVSVPVIVRLEGTKAQEGRSLLAESGLDIIAAADLDLAARAAVEAAQ